MWIRSCISYLTLAKGAGRKGEQKRRERAYSHHGTNESPVQSPFTEIWHNNHPLVICSLSQVPLTKKLVWLLWKRVSQRSIGNFLFDIVIKHKERWQYLNWNRTSELDPVYLPSSSKTPTARFYCIRTKSIHSRFHYFTSALLEVNSEVFLTGFHKKVINPFKTVKGVLDYV